MAGIAPKRKLLPPVLQLEPMGWGSLSPVRATAWGRGRQQLEEAKLDGSRADRLVRNVYSNPIPIPPLPQHTERTSDRHRAGPRTERRDAGEASGTGAGISAIIVSSSQPATGHLFCVQDCWGRAALEPWGLPRASV